ncbi:MAG: exonuclease domain-containing protein [Perlabentimonas sp.]
MYAIIDIETTGGSQKIHRITEIAIYLFDGTKLVDQFTSLVNPDAFIPPNITRLTGITNEMVAKAPRFFEIAKKIVEITDNATFVAHNATFDYRFVQAEFKRLGYDYSRQTLCTVKLARKYLPGHGSYSLGVLCGDLGININGRHRAAGDALATLELFEILLKKNPNIIDHEIISVKKKAENIAPHLNPEKLLQIPESTGIYYFHDANDDIIYIGKSINIRKRVHEHITRPTTKRATEMLSQISDISYETTGSELIALILEADAIKQHLPKYNKRGRRRTSPYGLFSFEDNEGYTNLAIKKIADTNGIPITTFAKMVDGQTMLYKLIERYALCQKLCGLYKSANACFHHQIGQCKGACIGEEPQVSYNQRAGEAIESLGVGGKSFIIVDKGSNDDESSFVKVTNGKIEGYGYFNQDYIGNSLDLLNETLTPCGNHNEAMIAIRSFMRKPSVKVIEF